MAVGSAQILSGTGALILPADSPYDRQLLIDHVLSRARRTPQVKVRVDRTTWVIEPPASPPAAVCGGCTQRIDQLACRHPRSTAAYCVVCALARPQLTVPSLKVLPAATVLHDVQAHSAYGSEWIPWTRWPQATPAEIIEDMRLQRRFAPVLVWRCAEIRRPSAADGKDRSETHPMLPASKRLADFLQWAPSRPQMLTSGDSRSQ